jgi:AcrR family transcriptional regulator
MNAETPPAPTRRTQAERSEAMRARLAAAAYEAIADGGLKALRVRAVAQAAGVSQGALLHHFPDKNALILAAIEQALTLARDDSAAWLEQKPSNPEAVLRAMLAELRAFFFSDRFWVAMGITLEASKNADFYPVIRGSVASLRSPIYAAWAERLVALGWTPAEAARDVRSGAALISGAAIRRFWADCDALTEVVEEEWIAQRLARLSA